MNPWFSDTHICDKEENGTGARPSKTRRRKSQLCWMHSCRFPQMTGLHKYEA